MRLVLTDDGNGHHVYKIPVCVFYPESPINILGAPTVGKLFGENVDAHSPIAEDGTTIK